MWHVMCALASLSGTLFLVYIRSERLGEKPRMALSPLFLFPYIVRENPRRR
jgi:hypothetical protein